MPKIKIKQNSVGKWIDTKTGRFVSKKIYEPVVKAREAVNLKRSESLKEYWSDVKSIMKILNKSQEEARKYLHDTPKYVEKRGGKAYHWAKFWQNEKGKSKEERKQAKKQLEAEGYELISY